MSDDNGLGKGDNTDLRAATPSATPEGEVAVNVIAKNRDGASLLALLQALGLKGGASFGAVVSGYLPASKLDAVRALDNVVSARVTAQRPRQSSPVEPHHQHKSDLDSQTDDGGSHTAGHKDHASPVDPSHGSSSNVFVPPADGAGDTIHASTLGGTRVLPGVVDPLTGSSFAGATNVVVSPSDGAGDAIHAVPDDGTKVIPGVVDPVAGGSSLETTGVVSGSGAGADPIQASPSDPTAIVTPIAVDPLRAASQLTDDGYEAVNIIARDGKGDALLSDLQAKGLIRGGASWGSMASGYVKASDLAALQGSAGIVSATPSASSTFVGKVTNEADPALHADTARQTFGVDGSGVKVGILSDSFNTSGNVDTTTTDQASGDLPADTMVLNDSPGGTDEGRAMAQIVHDIAPGASIRFDTANGGDAVFAQHILDLANAGCKVIVDDVGYADELAYQDGPIAQAINKVKAMGVSYFSSSGNAGTNGYEGAFHTGSAFTYNGSNYTLDQFSPGVSRIAFTAGSKENITLEWNQPGASAGGKGATSDLDLFLTDANGNVISNLASTNPNIGADPTEFLSLQGGAGQTYYLEVGLKSGAAPTDMRIILQGGATLAPVAGANSSSTFFGHAAAQGAVAVAAAPYNQTPQYGTTPPKAESFTTHGPDPVYFDTAGNLLSSIDNRQVDVTGVDGGETTFFYPGSTKGPNGYPTFFGTSAAAPSVAAVAALMLQKNPNLTPDQIQTILQNTADHSTTTSTGAVDSTVTGYGLVNAAAAVAAATCFTDGTRIRLADGADVAVEDLVVGDLVETAAAEIRPIRWIGHRTLRPGEHRTPSSVWPVLVLSGAFGHGLPERDLMLSPGHPVLVGADADDLGGYLVPIMCLINGTTIRRIEAETVTYWHIELDAHDVLLAEGLPAESYLDWGDRAFFLEGTDHALVNPDFVVPGLSARCRPVAIDGPVVEAERRRLDTIFAMRLSAACAWPSHEDQARLQ